MTEVTAEPINVPDDLSAIDAPEVKALPEYPWIACDGHSSVQALFEVTLVTAKPGINVITVCGHCANRFGWGHSSEGSWMANENKTKGSDH